MVVIQTNEKNGLQLSFEKILCNENFDNCTNEVAEIIAVSGYNQRELGEIFKEYRKNFESHKSASLELILAYIRLIIQDLEISDEELLNVCLLKRFLRIKEGDFIENKSDKIAEILHHQFYLLYKNNRMEEILQEYRFRLQDLFDLSYDEFLEFERESIEGALRNGADIFEFDTYYPVNEFNSAEISNQKKSLRSRLD